MNLSDITADYVDQSAPLIGVFGAGGVGKTTFAASFPSPIFLMTEVGTKALTGPVARFPTISNYDALMAALKTLYVEEHNYQTVVVDSITRLEPLVWKSVCEEHRWKSIETPGYGKGYAEADSRWSRLMVALERLAQAQMNIVLIAHDEVRPVADPTTAPYDRFQMRLHKRAEAIVREHLDVLGYLHIRTHVSEKSAVMEKSRTLAIHPSPHYTAKCRYPGLPETLEINLETGASEFLGYVDAMDHKDPMDHTEAA